MTHIDSDLTMGEPESTPQAGPDLLRELQEACDAAARGEFATNPPDLDADDSDEPITVDWCIERMGNCVVKTPWGYLSAVYTDGPVGVMLSGTLMPNLKTRGEFRDLCWLLGVRLK